MTVPKYADDGAGVEKKISIFKLVEDCKLNTTSDVAQVTTKAKDTIEMTVFRVELYKQSTATGGGLNHRSDGRTASSVGNALAI